MSFFKKSDEKFVGPLDDTLKNQRYFGKKYVALTIKQLPESSGLFEQQQSGFVLSTYKAFSGVLTCV